MKHMLAAKCSSLEAVSLPVYASPKLDGIRATVIDGVLMSRNMKPIPNLHTQKLFGKKKYEGLDGELIVGPAHLNETFTATTSGVMSVEGTPDVYFHVFDDCRQPATPFHTRLTNLRARIQVLGRKELVVVPHVHVGTHALVTELEEKWLAQGFEGAMLRHPHGPYKYGRSTEREGWLLKLKRFEDSEAVVDGVEELEHNHNTATRDANGRSKRTSHKAGKVAGAVLGNLLVRDVHTGVAFSVGSGFRADARAALWEVREALVGQVIKYRYFPTGVKSKPRFPVFLGFRDPGDMDCK